MNFPHLKKFLCLYECRWTVVVQPICQHSPRSCLVELLSVAAIVSFGTSCPRPFRGSLLQAIRSLLTNPDCHFLAVLTALVQSILEGRTDCPISGVFGAGKTRAAAAMIAGLLVMDPTLKVMVVTKENAAAHAFAKHINLFNFHPRWKRNLAGWLEPRSLKKALPANRS